ncbi:MAG: O-antigen ligase family protein, partial [Vicinamibacterales bacterium]
VVARDRMLDLFGGGSGSLRLDIWSSALRMIRDRPLQGYGPDQFLYAYLPRYVEPMAWNERFTSHAHNLVLDFWVRLGIIGGAFVIVATLFCLRAVAQHVREKSHAHALPAAATVALAAVLAHGMVDNAYFSHDLAMSGWLLAVLAFGPTVDATEADSAGSEGVDDRARAGGRRSGIHWLAPVRQLDR